MGREIGTLIGDYRITGIIGSGGSGEVFRAEHVITRRVEAIKFLAHGKPATGEEEQRFLREIEVQASLHHPNIAAVHNACWTPEGLALVMELVDGEPLAAILGRGRVPRRDGIHYVLQTLHALGYAHEHGVVHRDIKPGNIIVAADGAAKLTDFGLARPLESPDAANSNSLSGSPYYMSPEQVVGVVAADARSDYYSLGVVLYEVATGSRPFDGESAFDVMLRHRDAIPVPPVRVAPDVGATLNRVILKAMEKDPARRFQTAAEFQSALERALADFPASAPVVASRRPRGLLRRQPWIAAAAVSCVVCAAALVAALYPPPKNTHARPAVMQPVPAPPPPKATVPKPPPKVEAAPPVKTATPARRRKAPVKPRIPAKRVPEVSAVPREVRPAPKPEAPLPIPPPAVVVPVLAPAPVARPFHAQPPAPEATPVDAAVPPQPARKRNFLWRALGKVARPFSGGTPERPRP